MLKLLLLSVLSVIFHAQAETPKVWKDAYPPNLMLIRI
jgi:hypothetical protein